MYIHIYINWNEMHQKANGSFSEGWGLWVTYFLLYAFMYFLAVWSERVLLVKLERKQRVIKMKKIYHINSLKKKNLCSYHQRNGWYSKLKCKQFNKETGGEGALKRLVELRKESSTAFLSRINGRRGSQGLIMNIKLWHGAVRTRPRRRESQARWNFFNVKINQNRLH